MRPGAINQSSFGTGAVNKNERAYRTTSFVRNEGKNIPQDDAAGDKKRKLQNLLAESIDSTRHSRDRTAIRDNLLTSRGREDLLLLNDEEIRMLFSYASVAWRSDEKTREMINCILDVAPHYLATPAYENGNITLTATFIMKHCSIPLDIMIMIINAAPQVVFTGLLNDNIIKHPRPLLHIVAKQTSNLSIVLIEKIYIKYPSAIFQTDMRKNLPIHMYMQEFKEVTSTSIDGLIFFLKQYPQGMFEKNDDGMSPFQYVIRKSIAMELFNYHMSSLHERHNLFTTRRDTRNQNNILHVLSETDQTIKSTSISNCETLLQGAIKKFPSLTREKNSDGHLPIYIRLCQKRYNMDTIMIFCESYYTYGMNDSSTDINSENNTSMVKTKNDNHSSNIVYHPFVIAAGINNNHGFSYCYMLFHQFVSFCGGPHNF